MTESSTKTNAGAGIRRVVTGHDATGKAVVISDGITPNVRTMPERPGFSWNEVWVTSSMPARNDESGEPTDGPRTITPPANGTKCRIIEYPPDSDFVKTLDPNVTDSAFSDSPNTTHVKNARHPYMHRTETIDYAIVISGEITMLLDDTDVLLKAGDVVVQRGTNHAWSNRSNAVCRIAFVLIDAVPLV
jgi:mannose-6-phosphate isomerase-like protein (cupin superfamily)